ncbi:uncharacterized protein DUF4087 [Rhodobacter aestuarii]|uniref:DUF4087 domain-containing protein n=1 Tax=Rhodobacter aestuarii TaxID=453582 RepID=A0A1N7KTF7_9RHOB|nr:DUF4087 domain-containing protein [Rhodobacter aestuarii]PTV95585.1 uncharacterized protein DUF4087 [Rhodobacter aestuarii]SIS64776.1 Protein of unknown function [Rhodobacter aestuarii]
MTAMAGCLPKALCAALVVLVPVVAAAETRCGWFANPTPGNFWLTDADATWELSVQGMGGVPGWDDLDWGEADFTARWVEVNGHYGYGCACIEGSFGAAAEGTVLRITRLRALPLSKCENDPALAAPGE